jgi:outer membrane translocation and assembly module TamA
VHRSLVVLLALAACGSAPRARPRKPGVEYLDKIVIEGNQAIPSRDLIPGLALQRTALAHRSIDDYQLQLDGQRIAAVYQKHGFLSVAVKTRIDRKGDAATIVFHVDEGPRATVQVEIIGLPPEVNARRARREVKLEDGAPFDYAAYDDAKVPLSRLVEDAGYAHVVLDAKVIADRARSQAILRYVIDPGPRCTFGAVTIEGEPSEALRTAVLDRTAFDAGAPYSTTALETTHEDLYKSKLFSSVRIEADRTTAGTVIPVKITVSHGKLNHLAYGIGFAIDPLTKYLRLRLNYTRDRFLTPLTTASVELRPDLAFENCGWDLWNCDPELRGRLFGRLSQRDVLGRDVNADVTAGYEYLILEAFTRYGPRADAGVTLPLDPKVKLRLGWQYSQMDFQDFKIDAGEAASIGANHPNLVGAYTAAVIVDLRTLRKDTVEPDHGVYFEVRGQLGTPYAGGDFNYTEVIPELRGYYRIRRLQTTLAARLRIGRIGGDVPVIERFFSGGVSGHRGFATRHLSPEDPTTGIAIGGAGLMESSFEIRRALYTVAGADLGGTLFVDAGDVTRTFGELDPTNPNIAVGAALGYISPIGPIGLSVARRLNRTGPGNPDAGQNWNFELVVGEAF